MSRMIIYRQNGGEHSVAMFTGKLMVQRIDVSGMTPDQVVETMGLSIQWMREGQRPKGRKFNAAVEQQGSRTTTARKAKIIHDINLSEKVARYAEQMAEFTQRKREARQKARLEALLQKEGS